MSNVTYAEGVITQNTKMVQHNERTGTSGALVRFLWHIMSHMSDFEEVFCKKNNKLVLTNKQPDADRLRDRQDDRQDRQARQTDRKTERQI